MKTIAELNIRTKKAVREVFTHLYEIHRPLIVGRCSLGTDAYAEAAGKFDIALNAITAAEEAAEEALQNDSEITDEKLSCVASEAALNVFRKARKDGLIYLRDGTRSATVVRAYLLLSNSF